MKHKILIILALILLGFNVSSPLTVIAAGIAQPEIKEGDKFLVGQTYTLAKGETLIGNLVMIGGTLTTEEGSTVQ
ncbi:MAG: hypothetical protein HGA28_08655, partial [Anaerolineaceae bacterium]|nr:hypothetical protein [Anaerolineaceae bacterium]